MDKFKKRVSVGIHLEGGCNPQEGEYSIYLGSFTEPLDLSSVGGVDDISLIKDCIENNLDIIFAVDGNFIKEGYIQVSLFESGEPEGNSFHKYYEIDGISVHDYV